MIALISYHKEPNYGTALQAYALAHAIRSAGKDCEYINYTKMRRKPAILFLLRRMKQAVLRKENSEFAFFNTEAFRHITSKFHEFHEKHIPASETTYYIDTLPLSSSRYERFIVGSDQTWSPFMNQHPYTQNFLEFCTEGAKKSAYAPSIGTLTPQPTYVSRMVKALKTFDFLSCREKANCEVLSKELKRNVEYVVDPTLLLSEVEWMQIASNSSTPQQPYILAYILGKKQCISDFAEKLGKEYSLPVYYIATRPEHLSHDNVLDDVGPAEFVSLIKNARYVVTDSFHGTIFSINFNVNFYSFTKRTEANAQDNDRIPSILNEYGLSSRFKQDTDLTFNNNIDFTYINNLLKEQRELSLAYLKKIITY